MTHELALLAEIANYAPRDKLVAVEQIVRGMMPVDVVIRHHFAKGVYAREGSLKAGTWFVGRVHHQSQINIISMGDVLVLTEDGPIRMTAPCTLVSPPGAQRAAYIIEDTVWTTILGTEETDQGVIYDTYTSPTYGDFKQAQDEILKIIEG